MKELPPFFSRREFLACTATASVATVLASHAATAPMTTPSSTRYERIDCQSHLFCPELVGIMEQRKIHPTVYTKDGIRTLQMGDWLRKIPDHYMSVDRKLATMDANHIARTALS